MIFESERLTFRLLEKKDTDELFSIWGDSETMRFCGGTVENEKISHIINYNLSQFNRYGNAVFAVVEKGKFIGICGGKLDEDNPFHVEVIIHISKAYWHNGYATEAVKSYIKWLMGSKKASYIYASAHPCNKASIKIVKKCGFTQNGFKQFEDTGFVDEPYFKLFLDS